MECQRAGVCLNTLQGVMEHAAKVSILFIPAKHFAYLSALRNKIQQNMLIYTEDGTQQVNDIIILWRNDGAICQRHIVILVNAYNACLGDGSAGI